MSRYHHHVFLSAEILIEKVVVSRAKRIAVLVKELQRINDIIFDSQAVVVSLIIDNTKYMVE